MQGRKGRMPAGRDVSNRESCLASRRRMGSVRSGGGFGIGADSNDGVSRIAAGCCTWWFMRNRFLAVPRQAASPGPWRGSRGVALEAVSSPPAAPGNRDKPWR